MSIKCALVLSHGENQMYLISLGLNSPVLINVSASVISWPWAPHSYSRRRVHLSLLMTENFHSIKEKDHTTVLYFMDIAFFCQKTVVNFPRGKGRRQKYYLKLNLGKGVAVVYLGNLLGYYMLKQILDYLSCSNYESKMFHTASKLLGNCW